MASDYDYLKELFTALLEPVKNSINELKTDVKVLNDRLLQNREKYAKDIEILAARIDKIENYITDIKPKSEICQNGFESKLNTVKNSISNLEKELSIILLLAKNPRIFIAIIIGLYLLSISDAVPMILKQFLLK